MNEEYVNVLHDFTKFFHFLEEIFEGNLFFKKSSTDLIKEYEPTLKKDKSLKIVTVDKSEAYLEYFQKKLIKVDKRVFRKRFTQVFYELDPTTVDIVTTYTAFRPNYTHSIDATYVRLILHKLDKGILTIHDSFGVPIFEVNLILKAANTAINELNPTATVVFSSPFILI